MDGAALAQRIIAGIKSKRTTVISTTQKVGSQTNKGTGVLRYLDDGVELSLKLTVASQTLRMIIVPQAFYVAGPTKVQGKTWIKVTGSSSGALGALADQLSTSVNYDTLVKPLSQATVTAGGRSVVNGVQVTKYTFSLTEKQIIDQLPAAQRSAVGDQLKGIKATQSMWVDDAGLPALIVYSTVLKGVTTTQTTTYRSWGSKVTVTVPAAADVVEAPAT